MLGLKLNHVSKRGHWWAVPATLQAYRVQTGGGSVHTHLGSFSQWCQIDSCAPRQIPHRWALQEHFAKQYTHIWGAFHSGAKSTLVLPEWYLTGELYRSILWNTLVPFARRHLGNNYCYQDDNATPHHARVVLDFLKQGNVTKMEQLARSPDCNPIKHMWDELGCAITSMGNWPQNIGELYQALLDKWVEIPV